MFLVCFHSGKTERKQAECLAQKLKIGSSHHTEWKYCSNQHQFGSADNQGKASDKIEL